MSDSNSDTNPDDSMSMPATTKRKATTTAAAKGKKIKQTKAKAGKKAVEDDEDDFEEEGVSMSIAAPVPVKKVAKKGKKAAPEVVEAVESEVENGSLLSKVERLERKIVVLEKEIESKNKSFDALHELRITRPEESEKKMLEISVSRSTAAQTTLDKYKSENAELRQENSTLRSSTGTDLPPSRFVPDSPGSESTPTASLARIKELEKEIIVIEGEKEKLASKVRSAEAKSYSVTVFSDKISELEELVEAARAKEKKLEDQLKKLEKSSAAEVQKAVKEIQSELSQAQTELAAEVEHSKSLQIKLRPSSNPSSQATSSNLASEKSKNGSEFEELKARFQLAEDFTGLQVTSVNTVGNLVTFTCLLTDLLGKIGALSFNVIFADDGTISYSPQIDPERDAELLKILPRDLQGMMRFDAENTNKWFRNLWGCINNSKLDK